MKATLTFIPIEYTWLHVETGKKIYPDMEDSFMKVLTNIGLPEDTTVMLSWIDDYTVQLIW